MITDLVESLATHGIRKCVLLNGHGGNDLKWVLRELHRTTPGPSIPLQLVQDRGRRLPRRSSSDKDDHAGEMETSLGLAHFPDLVALDQADPGAMAASRFEAVNQGWVEITRPWHLLTTNSGAGDPRRASAAKGNA